MFIFCAIGSEVWWGRFNLCEELIRQYPFLRKFMREGNAIRYGDQKSRDCKMQILQTLSADMRISI